MYPRYGIPPIVIIDLCHAFAKVVRKMLRHRTRRPCLNCGMRYCDGRICRQLAEQRRRTADLLAPWATTVAEATREFK